MDLQKIKENLRELKILFNQKGAKPGRKHLQKIKEKHNADYNN